MLPVSEPPGADPHAGWCGEGRLEAGLYPIYARLYPNEVAGLLLLDPTHPRNWQVVRESAPEAATFLRTLKVLAWPAGQEREFEQQTDCLDSLPPQIQPGPPTQILFSGRPDEVSRGEYWKRLAELRQDWLAMTSAPRLEMVWDSGHYIQKERPDAVGSAVRRLSGLSSATHREVLPESAHPLLQTGKSRQEQVRAVLGEPKEILEDGTVWIYSKKTRPLPSAVSLLPVIGDLAEVVELLEKTQGRHEWIVQFDQAGLALRISKRKVD